MKKRKFILPLFLMLPFFSVAQKTSVGKWFAYLGNNPINKKWNWHNEIQYRNYNFIGDLEQLLIRTGVGYNLSENNNNILLGYSFLHTERYIAGTDNKESINEHRIYQQFITRQRFNRLYLQHRYRFEQRFFKDDFRLRARYSLGINIPLNKKEMSKGVFYLNMSDEVFFNTKKAFFDRNRFYATLGFMPSKHTRVELGIMTQTLETNSRSQIQFIFHNHIPFYKENP